MRGRGLIGVVLAASMLMGGCGGAGEERAASSSGGAGASSSGLSKLPKVAATPSTQPVPARVLDRLAAGAVAVSDLTGKAAIEPATVQFATDASLTGVRWTRWGAGGATGHGTLRVLSCNPNCAEGDVEQRPATIELARPSVCPDGRFFSASKVVPDGGPAPASYVRAPC
jgi:hypothetical protein